MAEHVHTRLRRTTEGSNMIVSIPRKGYGGYMLLEPEYVTPTADETELVIDDVLQGVNPHPVMPDGWLGAGGTSLYSVCGWRRRMEG